MYIIKTLFELSARQLKVSLYNPSLNMKEMLYAVRCLKSSEDMILALAGQSKQLSHEPEKNLK